MQAAPSAPPKLVVSIINYRTGPLSIACAASALADRGEHDVEVVLVDNASGDGSADEIATWIETLPADSPVRLVRSEVNTGFSGGHNIGIQAEPADWYLLLNSDAVLRAGFFDALTEAIAANPKAGLIAPQLEGEEGEVQNSLFRFASPISELTRAAHTGVIDRLFARYRVPLGTDPDTDQIEWASFACIALNGAMVREIGLMDEGYFLYYEDSEYCLRARRAGWPIARAPGAVAVHYRGGSGPVKALQKAKKRMPAYFYASRSRFLYQAHGRAGLILANLLWHLGRGIAQARRVLGRPAPPAAEAEARDLWINAFSPLGPRYAPHETKDKG